MVRTDSAASAAISSSSSALRAPASLSDPPNVSSDIRPKKTPLKKVEVVAASPDRKLSFNFVEVKSGCTAHPSRSKSYGNLINSDGLSNSLRPCLRHKRVLSHSCDDLLNNSSFSKTATSNSAYKSGLISSNMSICSGSINSAKSVKFLLPEKKVTPSVTNDVLSRRFSTSALVSSPPTRWTAAGMPSSYYNKYLQNFGAQFIFGQNFDRYLWSNVCCPCYQCHPFQMPYYYSFGHYNSQFSMSGPERSLSIEMADDSSGTNRTNNQEGTISI